MKKYLLLASTALLFSTNAMATHVTDDASASITVAASLASGLSWDYNNVNFGTIVLSSTAADGDTIASFQVGEFSVAEGKTIGHGGAEAGWVSISTATTVAGGAQGVTFDDEVQLKNDQDQLVAKMINIEAQSSQGNLPSMIDDEHYGWYIDGDLQLLDKAKVGSGAREISGTMTATLQF